MAANIGIRIDDRAFKRQLRDLGKFFGDEAPVLSAIGDRHLSWIDENFRKAGAERKWPPLSPNTVAGRRGGSSQPLRDTGRLAASFVKKVSGDRVDVGTEDKRALWHHEGTAPFTIRPKNKKVLRFTVVGGVAFARFVEHPGLPERPLLPTDALGERLAVETVEAAIDLAAKDFNRRRR